MDPLSRVKTNIDADYSSKSENNKPLSFKTSVALLILKLFTVIIPEKFASKANSKALTDHHVVREPSDKIQKQGLWVKAIAPSKTTPQAKDVSFTPNPLTKLGTTSFYPDKGCIYIGEFDKRGKRNGKGTLTSEDGLKVWSGEFKNGMLDGNVTLTLKSLKEKVELIYSNGKIIGKPQTFPIRDE